MRKLGLLTAAAIAAATLTATTTHAATTAQQIQSLRSGIQWERARTWHWQQVAGIRRSPTIRGAALSHSVGYLRWIERKWERRRVYAYKLAHRPRPTYRALSSSGGSVPAVICRVFGAANCATAKTIAYRESRYNPSATNGTHWGLFQLDSSALHSYASIGYSTVYEQVVAAHNMFLARGWEPWTCCEG